jgi:hypothetical protein
MSLPPYTATGTITVTQTYTGLTLAANSSGGQLIGTLPSITGAFVSAVPGGPTSVTVIVGFTNVSAFNNSTNTRYGFFVSDSAVNVQHNVSSGGSITLGLGAHTAGDVFYVSYDGATMFYYQNSALVYSAPIAIPGPLYALENFYGGGSGTTTTSFRWGSTDVGYTGPTGPAGPIPPYTTSGPLVVGSSASGLTLTGNTSGQGVLYGTIPAIVGGYASGVFGATQAGGPGFIGIMANIPFVSGTRNYYAFAIQTDQTVQVYHGAVTVPINTHTAGDLYLVAYDGATMRYFVNSQQVYSATLDLVSTMATYYAFGVVPANAPAITGFRWNSSYQVGLTGPTGPYQAVLSLPSVHPARIGNHNSNWHSKWTSGHSSRKRTGWYFFSASVDTNLHFPVQHLVVASFLHKRNP